ncbi:MAG: hypothetical protein E7031_06245 [Akkermansiaceae bacterium]|nr:hypothetical protein [Akkermansiaceae bacterium]
MIKKALYTVTAVAAIIAPVMAAEWETDIAKAKERATAEGKAILINFTGSDWCVHCRRLKYAVLDTPEFAAYTADKYVLLEVDLPRHAPVEATELEKRKALSRQYNVSGFPTIIMTDAGGELLDGVVGGGVTYEGMKMCMDRALARQESLKEARKLSGEERAAALVAIYNEFPKRFENAAAALRKEIAEHDPQDTTGMQQQAAADAQMQELMNELSHYGTHEYQGKAKVYDTYLAKAHPLNRVRIMERKRADVIFPCLNIMLLNAKTIDDIYTAKAYVMKEAETCYPEDIREEMIQALEAQFAEPEKMLEGIKRRRR